MGTAARKTDGRREERRGAEERKGEEEREEVEGRHCWGRGEGV